MYCRRCDGNILVIYSAKVTSKIFRNNKKHVEEDFMELSNILTSENLEIVTQVLHFVLSIISLLLPALGIFKAFNLIKSPIPIQGLECFEKRLQIKHARSVVMYILLTILIFVVGLDSVFTPDDNIVLGVMIIIFGAGLVGLIFSGGLLIKDFFQNAKLRKKFSGVREHKTREHIFLFTSLVLIGTVGIVSIVYTNRVESVDWFKLISLWGLMSVLEILLAYVYLISPSSEEYEALLYYFDGNRNKIYIYYRYDEQYFICGTEPNTNDTKYHVIKKWDEIKEKKLYQVRNDSDC